MSDEQIVQAAEAADVEGQEVESKVVEGTENEADPIEARAIEMGWRPKSDFDGDEVDFIDAKEFVRRKPLFDKIEHQSKELKEVKKVLRSLQDHHVKVKETEFQRAVDYLKAQKKQAYEDGDTDKIIELDDQIAEMRDARKTSTAAQEVSEDAKQIHPDFASWVNRNDWYARDKSLRTFADSLGVAYAQDNPHLSPTDVLKHVTASVKRAYPEKFTNPNKDKPAAVDGGNASTKSTPTKGFQLTEDEERVMKQFVRSGILTKEQYISDIRSMRGE
jgi:hypothetical protein